MAYHYKAPQRDQQFLLPPSISDWLGNDHLVWFVLDVISMVDTSAFDRIHPNDGPGRPAYDPQMMLAILLFAYTRGLRSSRRIEEACRTDLAFRAICCDIVPDASAISRFRADQEEPIKGVFTDVLRLCAKAGLASLGVIAIDGTKIGSDASLRANRTEETIRAEVDKILAEARRADAARDHQPTLEGSLPEELARPGSRLARLQGALEEIEAQRRAEEEAEKKASEEAEAGRRLRGRKPKDPHKALHRAEADVTAARNKLASTKAKNASERAKQVLEAALSRLAEATKAATEAPPKTYKANTTDPESRIMKTQTGWVQGFNCQAAVNENQVVIAPAVTQDHNDAAQFVPMTEATKQNASAAGIADDVGLALADAGYWSEANATSEGPDRLIATQKDWKQRKAAQELGTTTGAPPEDSSVQEQMEHRLRTEEGAVAYAMRKWLVEPVFGQHKEDRGVRRFMRRGLEAAESEWSFVCTTGNVLKLFALADGATLADVLVTT